MNWCTLRNLLLLAVLLAATGWWIYAGGAVPPVGEGGPAHQETPASTSTGVRGADDTTQDARASGIQADEAVLSAFSAPTAAKTDPTASATAAPPLTPASGSSTTSAFAAAGASGTTPPMIPPGSLRTGGTGGGDPPPRRGPLADPAYRAQRVGELDAEHQAATARAKRWAEANNEPMRIEVDGGVIILVDYTEEDGPIYRSTFNLNAGISTAANLIRNTAPYNVNGSGIVAGIWDGGNVRATHTEFFNGRVVNQENFANDNHATHVAGTMIARGASASALGMAPAAQLLAYEFNNDLAEMTGRAMAAPGEAGKVQVSNHSYGFLAGWATQFSPRRWYGTWGNRESDFFGQYSTTDRDRDKLIYEAPYYLPFISAGNDRSNTAPATGATFEYFSSGAWRTKTYDPNTDPYNDGYKNGYDTIPFGNNPKNAVVVGAVNDAVTSGQRDVSKATMSGFSSWGQTDDGRIKPDIVANGVSVTSSGAGGDASYLTYDGTSMAAPNASGSALLLLQHWANLFPGQFMWNSTIKGLIIHTADMLDAPGPDYRNGWGLMNAKAAADHMSFHATNPGAGAMIEDVINTSRPVAEVAVAWDGNSPLKATVVWTDPPGTARTGLNNTTRALVNDLDLRIVAPNGTTYLPWILDPGNPSQAATTGDNIRDNVEQVYLATPPQPGIYNVRVTHKGSLSGNQQHYSLMISGAVAATEISEEPSSLSPVSSNQVPGVQVTIAGRPTAADTPDNYNSWTTGTTAGSGFGAWTLTASGTAGHFLANNPANMHVGSSKGFGLFASAGGVSTARRDFTSPLGVGDVFTLRLDNNWITDNSQVGFALADASGNVRLRFYFVGGEELYRVTDAVTGRQTSLRYTANGLEIKVQLQADGNYLLVANNVGVSGSLASGGPISRLIVENNNAGSGSNYDLFVGAMSLQRFLGAGTDVRLVRSGRADIVASGVQLVSGQLQATFDLTGAAAGLWTVVATNPDGSTLRFDDSFTVTAVTPFEWSENFDGTVSGWSSAAVTGSNSWTISTAQAHSAPNSYFAPGPASRTTVRLTSPAIAVPAGATDMQLRFRHSYNLESQQDGGRLEISVDDGASWFTVESSGSGVSFGSRGYDATISSGGQPASRSEFAGLSAWTGNSNGFIETILNVTDSAKFAGKSLRFRWALATDASTASTGWYVDTISLTGLAPSAGGGGEPVEASVTLGSLAATYDGTPKAVSVTTSPPDLAVSVTYNGSASVAVNAGSYAVVATVTDPNYTGSASGTLVIARASQTITFGALPAKTFGDAPFAAGATASSGLTVSYASSNTNVATVSGGTISVLGTGTANITATQGGNSNYEAATPVAQTLTVAAANASVTLGNLSQTYDGSAKTVSVTTDPPNLAVTVTYDGSATPPAQGGSYTVVAAVTEPNYAGSASGTLVIARAAQSITFGALPAKTFGDAPLAAGATASSGLAVSYTSSNANVATVDGGSITIVGAGSAVITASQAGDTNHEAATTAEQILTVVKATATVTLGGLSQAFDGEPKPVTVTTDPDGLVVDVIYDGESTPPTEVGSYAVVATVNDDNYTGSASGTLVIDDELLTFERWISRFEGLSDVTPEGDPDGDGLSNAMEYFMDLDPTVDDAAGAMVQGVGSDEMYLDYRRSKEIHGITGTVKWSTSPDALAPWSSGEVTDVLLQDHGTWERRRASVPWLTGAEHIFLRLDLTME